MLPHAYNEASTALRLERTSECSTVSSVRRLTKPHVIQEVQTYHIRAHQTRGSAVDFKYNTLSSSLTFRRSEFLALVGVLSAADASY